MFKKRSFHNGSPCYSISDLAAEFALTHRSLRFYEDMGLLAPARRGATRVYDIHDRARLKTVVRARRAGISLAEIKEVLDLCDTRDEGAAQVQRALEKYRERIEALYRRRALVDEAIEELEDGERRLREALDGDEGRVRGDNSLEEKVEGLKRQLG